MSKKKRHPAPAMPRPKKRKARDWNRMSQTLNGLVRKLEGLYWLVILHCSDPLCQLCEVMHYRQKPSYREIKSDVILRYGFYCDRIRVNTKKKQIRIEGKCDSCHNSKDLKE